jgi:hypothetical protein
MGRGRLPRLPSLRHPRPRLRPHPLRRVRRRAPRAFSCKGRGVCPSCNARRMVEVAAHLTDQVLPPLPLRQWVLSLPKRIRPFLPQL